ncbi:CaiB/BaiF CoA transferase family protein [Brevibacterium casei]|uniref:Carnitine dehydratase n=1 Tax=Brevibacterium casei TaxID=33889 RepID=A0AB34XWT1_9MICO|nr:CaiB/BaiF CoA-transferase family protein [Brevibacterium casei]KZE23095.1 carnitine dehydratase [Brevibacterium casei]
MTMPPETGATSAPGTASDPTASASDTTTSATDPGMLDGVRVLDLGGIGPGPFATMMLADLGAEVIRLDPPQATGEAMNPVLDRGKKSVIADLKTSEGIALARAIAARSDIVIEGFRPGAAERLGLGPGDLQAFNPALVYGRITGYGQDGPKAQKAGHDLGYIASTGLLAQLGRADGPPQFPANLLGDFGGGGMLLVVGVLSGLTRARASGAGTVVDAAMIDGANLLYAMMHGFAAMGLWRHDARGRNLLDSGAPFYDVYPTADGRHLSVACIERPFFNEFVRTLGLEDELPEPLETLDHWQPQHWPALRAVIAPAIAARTLAELESLFAGRDACVEPILTMAEAKADAHNVARGLFAPDADGVDQPAPAPRFAGAGTGRSPRRAPRIGDDTAEVIAGLGR